MSNEIFKVIQAGLVSMLITKEQMASIYDLDHVFGLDYKVVVRGEWIYDGKYVQKKDIAKINGMFYEITFNGYMYYNNIEHMFEDTECPEVAQKEVTKLEWVKV